MGLLEPSHTGLNVTQKIPGSRQVFDRTGLPCRLTSRARRQADASRADMPGPAVSAREGATRRRVWKRWSSSPLLRGPPAGACSRWNQSKAVTSRLPLSSRLPPLEVVAPTPAPTSPQHSLKTGPHRTEPTCPRQKVKGPPASTEPHLLPPALQDSCTSRLRCDGLARDEPRPGQETCTKLLDSILMCFDFDFRNSSRYGCLFIPCSVPTRERAAPPLDATWFDLYKKKS